MKPFIFSEEEILDWTSAYYDKFLDDKDNQEAEIVDANIEVPQEAVKKAEKSFREKFEAVYKELVALSKNNYPTDDEKEMYANEKGRYEDFYLAAASTVGAGLGFGAAMFGAGAGNITGLVVGASCGLVALLSPLIGHPLLAKRQRKLNEDAQSVGLTMAELDWVREYEKNILKSAKKSGITPRFGTNTLETGNVLHFLYLETKMLHHKFLMQDQQAKESEVVAQGLNDLMKRVREETKMEEK